MAIKIGSNIASIQAQRRLDEATSSLSTIYERLSSGQRINKASDDAAGLAISSDLNSKSRIFSQAIRNVNDGISLHAIADGTTAALSDIAIRLKELSEQSANGTYSNTQRKAIDKEAQTLSSEFTRITQSAQFNGQKLFDGSLADGVRLQAGIGTEGSILTHISEKMGTGSVGNATQLSAESSRSGAVQLADLNGDGILDMVTAGDSDSSDGYATVRLGTGGGSFGAATSYLTESKASIALALGDVNGDGKIDIVTSGYSDSNNGYATIRLGNGNGSFGTATSFLAEAQQSRAVALSDINNDGIIDLITAGRDANLDGYATIRLGTGNGNFGAATSYATEGYESTSLSFGDLNGDGILDLVTVGYSDSADGYATVRMGNGDGSFRVASSYLSESQQTWDISLNDLNGDGFLDLITAGRSDSQDGYATVRLGSGNGSFGSSTSYSTESLISLELSIADLNGDGVLDLVTAGCTDAFDGYATIRLGTGNGSFGSATSYTTESRTSEGLALGDLNGDGVLDIVTAGYTDASFDGIATIRLGDSRDGIAALQPFSLQTRAYALLAMPVFTKTLESLSSIRGTLGANESRLNAASANLATSRENYLTASSRITDVDLAQESSNLVRTQILQQAASAILAQANQAPTLALSLLK